MGDRKNRTWAYGNVSSGLIASGGVFGANLLALYAAERGLTQLTGLTVAAIYGTYTQVIANASTGLTLNRVAVAIGVVPTPPGGGSPIPGTDSYPWMFFREFSNKPKFQETATGVFGAVPMVEYTFEVRAQRKLQMGMDLGVKVTNSTAFDMAFNLSCNVLLLG